MIKLEASNSIRLDASNNQSTPNIINKNNAMAKGHPKQERAGVNATAAPQLSSKRKSIKKEQDAGGWPPKNTPERAELVKELR